MRSCEYERARLDAEEIFLQLWGIGARKGIHWHRDVRVLLHRTHEGLGKRRTGTIVRDPMGIS